MRILEIIPQLDSGGAERFTVDLCNELVLKGHQVRLLLFFPIDNPKYTFYLPELNPNVEVVSLNKGLGFELSTYKRVADEIKSFHPDVVHSHVRGLFYLPLAIWRYHKQIKFFHTVHNDAQKEALGSKLDVWIRRFFFKKNWVQAVTISPESADSFKKFYGIEAPMIYNGRNIDADITISPEVAGIFQQVRITDNTKVIVNVAHIDRVKRQDILARAITDLNKEGYDVSLVLVGRIGDDAVAEQIKRLDNPRIHIMGARTNPLEFMKSADAFCLSSQYEGLPISLIEALGVGTIPICTPVGGIKNLITDGHNGFLSSDISEEAIYSVIKRFLNADQSTIDGIRLNLPATYSDFTMTKCATLYEELFTSGIPQKVS